MKLNNQTVKLFCSLMSCIQLLVQEKAKVLSLADWKTRPHELVVEQRNVTAADTLELALASSGGAAIRFKKAR